MDEEEIKKKMLDNTLQNSQEKQAEEALKIAMSKILEPSAKERLSNLRVVKPDMALQLEAYLFQLYQSGQIKGTVTEEQLIIILKKIGEKKEFNITRK